MRQELEAAEAAECELDGPDGLGVYVLKRMVFVSPSSENINPEDEEIVEELAEGLERL